MMRGWHPAKSFLNREKNWYPLKNPPDTLQSDTVLSGILELNMQHDSLLCYVGEAELQVKLQLLKA
jgi:hypothetical protein